MGVTYKLTTEVIHFIISQRQGNPLLSCRQLAESASEKFGLHLSKSSVHDVLKESGVVTPRGRKPKEKFEIPQEKKLQIQNSLSQVKLLTPPEGEFHILIGKPVPTQNRPVDIPPENLSNNILEENPPILLGNVSENANVVPVNDPVPTEGIPVVLSETKDFNDPENSTEYEGAGQIFYKAALWDLGIFTEDNIKESDWKYYLTYTKGIKVILENNKEYFIDVVLPLERCIREAVDGLINNVKTFIVDKISDQGLFKASMDAQPGFKIVSVSIVDHKDRIMFEYGDIVEIKRKHSTVNRVFVENYDTSPAKRAIGVFFSQSIDNICFINNILNLNGYDTTDKHELVVNLTPGSDFSELAKLHEASETLNGMNLYDEQDRRVSIKIF